MCKGHLVEILSKLQSQKISRGIRIRLENHLFPNPKQQNHLTTHPQLSYPLRKRKIEKTKKMYPASRIVPKTLWGF